MPRRPEAPPRPSERREQRELPKKSVERTTFTEVSPDHPDRNEDAVLGDPARVLNDLRFQPKFTTEMPNEDMTALLESLKKEQTTAADVRASGYSGVLDGISGTKKNGSGVLASRIASAEISAALAMNPGDMTVAASQEAMVAAITGADKKVREYKADRADLGEMGATIAMARTIKNEDGTFDVPYAFAGDCRIYVLDGATGIMHQETKDDIAADFMLEKGLLTPEKHTAIMTAQKADELPSSLRDVFRLRYAVVNGIGAKEMFDVRKGVITGLKPGDRVLISTDGTSVLDEALLAKMMADGASPDEIAAEARKHEKPGKDKDDMTMTMLEFNAGSAAETAPESGERVIDAAEAPANDVVADSRRDRVAEATEEIAALQRIQLKAGTTKDLEQRIADVTRAKEIDELSIDLENRTADVARMQNELGIMSSDAKNKLDSAKRDAEWSQRTAEAASLIAAEGSTEALEQTTEGKMAVAYVRTMMKDGQSAEQVAQDAAVQRRESMGRSEMLTKLAFEHAKIAELSTRLRKLEKDRDEARKKSEDEKIAQAREALAAVSSRPRQKFPDMPETAAEEPDAEPGPETQQFVKDVKKPWLEWFGKKKE